MSNPNRNLAGTSIPKLGLVRTNPEAAAVISKAVRNHLQARFDVSKPASFYSLNTGKMQSISDTQKDRLKENDNILDLFPDIVLAEQIIVSSILSPKDMFTDNLIYQTVDTLLPSHIQTRINDIIRTHLESYYDIKSELPEILRSAIFRTGSYVSAVIPEAAIDEIINGRSYATESHRNLINEIVDSNGQSISIGILGSGIKKEGATALESFLNNNAPTFKHSNAVSLEGKFVFSDQIKEDNNSGKPEAIFEENSTTAAFLEITDNYQLIKLPKLLEAIAEQRIKRAIRNPMYSTHQRTTSAEIASESYDVHNVSDPKKLNNEEFSNLIYKNSRPEAQLFTIFPNKISQKRHSVGRPLRIRIPSEAVIPVYPPGDPSNHRGYFVVVDIDGNWVTRSSIDSSTSGLQSLAANQNQTNNLTGLMLQKTHKTLSESQKDIRIDNMLEIYSSIVENDMITRLKNGIYGTQLEIGKDKEWDRIMLARALAGKMTRLVYLPAELITYYAFDYHPNGIGKSYLDQVKMLTSLRAVLLFSKVMAEMKNAINVTKIDMTLDADDPDPQKTIEIASHDVMRMRESFFPLGVNSPVDLLQWIQRAGMMFTFKGHPGLPETSFDFSTANLQHQVPDSATSDDLRKQTFMTFGLTPEQVDEGFSAQFATTIINQNALFAKRIALLSDKTAEHLTTDVRNICINDAHILKELMNVLVEAKDDVIKYLNDNDKEEFNKDPHKFLHSFIDIIIDNIWVDLPKPNVGSQEIKATDFNSYAELLDKVLNSFISSEVFNSSFDGEIASHADEIKQFWKHHLLRKWVTDEGFLSDISEIFKRDEDGNPSNDILELMTQYKDEILLSAMKFIKKSKETAKATDKDLNNLGVEQGQPIESSSGGTDDFGTGSEFDLPTGDEVPETPEEDESDNKPPEVPET